MLGRCLQGLTMQKPVPAGADPQQHRLGRRQALVLAGRPKREGSRPRSGSVRRCFLAVCAAAPQGRPARPKNPSLVAAGDAPNNTLPYGLPALTADVTAHSPTSPARCGPRTLCPGVAMALTEPSR